MTFHRRLLVDVSSLSESSDIITGRIHRELQSLSEVDLVFLNLFDVCILSVVIYSFNLVLGLSFVTYEKNPRHIDKSVI